MLCRLWYTFPHLLLVKPYAPGVTVTVLQSRKSRLMKVLVMQLLVLGCLLNARTEESVVAKQTHPCLVELTGIES